jgi:hypothetical protein
MEKSVAKGPLGKRGVPKSKMLFAPSFIATVTERTGLSIEDIWELSREEIRILRMSISDAKELSEEERNILNREIMASLAKTKSLPEKYRPDEIEDTQLWEEFKAHKTEKAESKNRGMQDKNAKNLSEKDLEKLWQSYKRSSADDNSRRMPENSGDALKAETRKFVTKKKPTFYGYIKNITLAIGVVLFVVGTIAGSFAPAIERWIFSEEHLQTKAIKESKEAKESKKAKDKQSPLEQYVRGEAKTLFNYAYSVLLWILLPGGIGYFLFILFYEFFGTSPKKRSRQTTGLKKFSKQDIGAAVLIIFIAIVCLGISSLLTYFAFYLDHWVWGLFSISALLIGFNGGILMPEDLAEEFRKTN